MGSVLDGRGYHLHRWPNHIHVFVNSGDDYYRVVSETEIGVDAVVSLVIL